MNIINIYENYNSYFEDDLKAIFNCCSEIASKNAYKLYLIGGMVRDLLLGQKSLDIDITVEGDAIAFARILEQTSMAKILSVHQSFGTVKVELQGKKIDFASTRSEIYPKKGQLPVIEKIGCTLKDDVVRRDFTINSLALSLNKNDFASLIDFVGGFEDLKNKKIRILHDKSFIDDPTRIIRALKYSSRLGFELEEQTLKLQEEYLGDINYDMCYKRVKQEIKKTFEHSNSGTFDKFINKKIYKIITQKRLRKEVISAEKIINKYKPKHQWIVYFGVVVIDEDLDKFELTKNQRDVIEGTKSLMNKPFENDFELYKAFCAQKLESLLILSVLGKEKQVSHYLNDLAKIQLEIGGNDLIKLGLKPSKQFNDIFDYVLKQKLQKSQISKEDELEIVKQYLQWVKN